MIWIILILIFLSVGIVFLFAMKLNWAIFVPVKSTQHSEKVLLTFDDGPHPVFTAMILDELEKYGAKGIFFMIGDRVAQYPSVAGLVLERGHTLGNHSYSHSIKNTFASARRFEEEIIRTDEALIQATGQASIYFRPPFGVTNPSIAAAIKRTGKMVIGWSLRSYDTIQSNPSDLADKILTKAQSGDIILLHDDRSITAEAMPMILKGLKEKGLL